MDGEREVVQLSNFWHPCAEVIHISLKEKSLESITDRQFNSLRKAYLKQADRFYRKNMRKYGFGGSRTLEYVGAAMMGAGVYGSTRTEHWWLALIMGSPGLVMIGRSVLQRRRMRKDILALLEKETADMPYEELEKKLSVQDYEPATRNEEQVKKNEMDLFAYNVTHQVMSKEHMLTNRFPTLAGIGAMLGGTYLANNSAQDYALTVAGGLLAVAGCVFAICSECKGFRKTSRLKKDIWRVIHDKGYEYFKLHANKARPYDFYKRHILPELEGKPTGTG